MSLRVTDWVGGKVYEYATLDDYLQSPFWLVARTR
jgi:hypothetical protein